MAHAISSSRPLHINFRIQPVKGHSHTVCVIHTKDSILFDSSDSACERPLDSTAKCGNGWEGAIDDMYNILLVHSDNHLKNLIKKKEDDDKIRDEEIEIRNKARENAMKMRASLSQGDDKSD